MHCTYHTIRIGSCLRSIILPGALGMLVACQPSTTQNTLDIPKNDIQSIDSKLNSNTASKIIFDIPALLHKSIPQIRKELGQPIDEVQANPVNTERSLLYENKDVSLTVDYFTDDIRVEVISLMGKRDSTSFQHLLPLGNLSANSRDYTIDTLYSEKKGFFRGVAVRLNKSNDSATVRSLVK